MTKYRVHLVAIAETSVVVEADGIDQAVEDALNNAPAGINISNQFDMGSWQLASDTWPGSKLEDDVEVVG